MPLLGLVGVGVGGGVVDLVEVDVVFGLGVGGGVVDLVEVDVVFGLVVGLAGDVVEVEVVGSGVGRPVTGSP